MRKGTILAAALAVLCGGAAVFCILQWQAAAHTAEAAQTALDQAQERSATLETELAEVRRDYTELEAQNARLRQRDKPHRPVLFQLAGAWPQHL